MRRASSRLPAASFFRWMIPAIWIFHYPAGGQENVVHFMENLAIAGGLLVRWAFGPGS